MRFRAGREHVAASWAMHALLVQQLTDRSLLLSEIKQHMLVFGPLQGINLHIVELDECARNWAEDEKPV